MSGESDESYWEKWRAELSLDSDEIYLNAGSYSPTPRSVQAAAHYWRTRLASSPMRALIETMPPQLSIARTALAQYLDADARQLLLLPNATQAVNVAVRSLRLPKDAVVLMPNHEYGAMRFTWEREAALQGYIIEQAPLPEKIVDTEQLLDAITGHFHARTRVLFFSHVTSPTGLILPVTELCRRAAERGIVTVIDGAHAPGMIPLSLNQVKADFYAGNCHKWMMAPIGAGFLHVADSFRDELSPLVTSWGWNFDADHGNEDSGWGGSKWSQRVEFQGTADRTPHLVLPDAIRFRHQLGEETVAARTRFLARYARERIAAEGLNPYLPQELTGTMTAFAIPDVDPVKAREWMWQTHRIWIPFTQAAGRSFLRVSTAWFNQPAEIDKLAEIVSTIPFDQLI